MSIVLCCEPRWISPYVFACWVTLTEKKIPFETRLLDTYKDETKAADYLAATVTGRVPSLRHDGFSLAESGAIIEYLEEVFPEHPVLPKDVRERARCRQIMSWLRSDETLPIRVERPTTTMFYEPATKPLSDEATAAAKKLCDVATRLIRSGQPNLFERWSIVDAELAFMLHRLIVSKDAVPDSVRAWAEAQWSRPSVQAFVRRERPPP